MDSAAPTIAPADPKSFEIAVANLLRLSVDHVAPETLLGHKKVDLYFEDRHLGKLRRVAVECKSGGTPLDQHHLSTIYANYLPLIDGNYIDEIMVVTYAGLAPSAAAMTRSARGLTHLRFDELQGSILDFRSYLGSVIYQFTEHGLSDYYIELKTIEGTDLEQLALDWISDDGVRPIALLGSYGMGKTTFAKRLASVLATKALEDSQARVPILVRLGDISAEQSLEGLLGKLFTATYIVRNYNFDLFMRLNNLGRFVILLDGFDEMKHSLSWDEVAFNLRQLNRLVTPASRVVLLGRPTAFMNDEEYQHALHGTRTKGGIEIREPGWPDYSEVHLAAFSREQVSLFLRKYFDYRIASATTLEEGRQFSALSALHIDQISGKQFYDIARRPVQLKMLAELLPQWKDDVSNLTVTLLYSLFIDLIIEREQQKDARRRFDKRARREFARDLAFWMWTSKREMSVAARDIPESIFAKFKKPAEDLEEVRRDFVAACFLERKIGDALYFPHRSFQEFLVAEALVERLSGRVMDDPSRVMDLGTVDSMLSEETASFMAGLVSLKTLKQWQVHLESFRGSMSWRLFRLWLSDGSYASFIEAHIATSDSPWHVLLYTVGVLKGIFVDDNRALRLLLSDRMRTSANIDYAILCFFCLICLSEVAGSDGPGEALSVLMSKGTLVAKRSSAGQVLSGATRRKETFQPNDTARTLLGTLAITRKYGGIEFGGLYPFLARHLRGYCMISEWIAGATLKTDEFVLPRKLLFYPTILDELQRYQDTYCKRKLTGSNPSYPSKAHRDHRGGLKS